MKWESRDTESITLQPWPAHGNGNKLPTVQTLKTMLTPLLSALGQLTLYVMINPLLKGRKMYLQKKRKVLLDISISERHER